MINKLVEATRAMCNPDMLRADPLSETTHAACRAAFITAIRSDLAFLDLLNQAIAAGPVQITAWTSMLTMAAMFSAFADSQLDEYPDFTPFSTGSLKRFGGSARDGNLIHNIRVCLEAHGLKSEQIFDVVSSVGIFVLMLSDDPSAFALLVQDANLNM